MPCRLIVAFTVGFMASHYGILGLVWSSTPGQDLRAADMVRAVSREPARSKRWLRVTTVRFVHRTQTTVATFAALAASLFVVLCFLLHRAADQARPPCAARATHAPRLC